MLPLTEKLDYIGASYITAPVSPRDGITHVLYPHPDKAKDLFLLGVSRRHPNLLPLTQEDIFLLVLHAGGVCLAGRIERSTRGNKVPKVTGGRETSC